MADERTRYFRRLQPAAPLGAAVERAAGGLGGAAAAVLTPYAGLGLADAVWAGAAGASVALAWWRWSDQRALAARPAPPPSTRPRPPPAPRPAGRRGRAAPGRAGRCWTRCAGTQTRYALRGSAIGTGLGPARPGLARPWPGSPGG